MSVFKRDDMRSLYGSFADAYRSYRDTFKNGQPSSRNKPKDFRVLEGVSDDEFLEALKGAVSACSGEKKERRLTRALQVYLGCLLDPDYRENFGVSTERNAALADFEPEPFISLKTVQNIFYHPKTMSIASFELLLEWLDKEAFKSSNEIRETEISLKERHPGENWAPNTSDALVADDCAPQTGIDHERKKLAAYEKLRELMLRRPERETFERELAKEYSARAAVEAIDLLEEEDRRYLLRTLALLLDAYTYRNDSLIARNRSGGDGSDLERSVVSAKNLAMSLSNTNFGEEVSGYDLCRLLANPEKEHDLNLALRQRKAKPESEFDPNAARFVEGDGLGEDVRRAAGSVSFDALGLHTGTEWDPSTVALLNAYTEIHE